MKTCCLLLCLKNLPHVKTGFPFPCGLRVKLESHQDSNISQYAEGPGVSGTLLRSLHAFSYLVLHNSVRQILLSPFYRKGNRLRVKYTRLVSCMFFFCFFFLKPQFKHTPRSVSSLCLVVRELTFLGPGYGTSGAGDAERGRC